MSKPDKPIFNQQGGRGKLYGPTHGATYMGTYQMPDGKMDRRMFNCATNKDAIKAYTDWCADMDARILEAMKEKVRPKAKAQQPKEKPAYTEPFKKDEAKGADMATTADAKLDKIYVVMVVGGVAVAWASHSTRRWPSATRSPSARKPVGSPPPTMWSRSRSGRRRDAQFRGSYFTCLHVPECRDARQGMRVY